MDNPSPIPPQSDQPVAFSRASSALIGSPQSDQPVALVVENLEPTEEHNLPNSASGADEPAAQRDRPPRRPRPARRPKPPQTALARAALPTQVDVVHISLTHHEAHCTICNHPARDAIEQGFLHWQRPSALAHEFGLGDKRMVYRHARAVGLYQIRASRSRRVLEFIMEQGETVTATADTVIRAVRAHSCLGEDGSWTEPAKRVILRHEYLGTPAEKFPT